MAEADASESRELGLGKMESKVRGILRKVDVQTRYGGWPPVLICQTSIQLRNPRHTSSSASSSSILRSRSVSSRSCVGGLANFPPLIALLAGLRYPEIER